VNTGSTPLPVLLVPLSPENGTRLEAHLPADAGRIDVRTAPIEQAARGAAAGRSVILVGTFSVGSDDPLGVVRRLRAGSDVPIVVLSDLDDENVGLDVLACGAAGYLLVDNTREEVLAGLRRAADGQIILDPAVGGRIASRLAVTTWREPLIRDAWNLRPRERQVLQALVDGRSNREIAQALHLGEETVKTHLRAVYRKLGARDRQQAVALTFQRRDPPPPAGPEP
jgi:DNA-binding NarL/FixJ family response regulator